MPFDRQNHVLDQNGINRPRIMQSWLERPAEPSGMSDVMVFKNSLGRYGDFLAILDRHDPHYLKWDFVLHEFAL